MISFSSIEPIYYLLPLIGFVVGFLGTVVGGGGGIFFMPILILLYGVSSQTAIATSLVATIPIGLAGTMGHLKKGNIDLKLGLFFSIAGIFGAIAGTYITSITSSEILKTSYGVYAIFMAISITYRWLMINKTERQNSSSQVYNIKSTLFGLSGGVVSGMFGTSGTAPVIAGLLSMDISLYKLIL